ncbi:uncharacterized protein LOC121863823 isoform X1 [Homarus americanus]|uniref:Uncharacterized protein n=1 Tax=Homarus americanus TaxID=6706 RepID=A0A8J5N0Z1_HOMAM|nr:uncharacterized protein LOC121863823 isoform X1 [Homarus americanus]KAG7170974.1 hypothetical protein Hamer_G012548 [Homarus americanus]
MWVWCRKCFGVGGGRQESVTPTHHPLSSAHNNLRLRRSVRSLRREETDDSQEEDDDEEEGEQEEDEYIQRGATEIHLVHPSAIPSTVIVRVQPQCPPLHRPDVACKSLDLNQRHSLTSSGTSSVTSIAPNSTSPSIALRSTSPSIASSSLHGSIRSLQSLQGVYSLQSAQSLASLEYTRSLVAVGSPDGLADVYCNVNEDFNGNVSGSVTDVTSSVGRMSTLSEKTGVRCSHPRFLTPEEAARPPQQGPPPLSLTPGRLTEYPPTKHGIRWPGKGLLSSVLGSENIHYHGEYTTKGNVTPVKLRSANTLRAIASYESRVDTKNNPVWYSFGMVVLALKYLVDRKELQVDVVQVTQLPPGKENSTLDFQVQVRPGRRNKVIKCVKPGPSLPSYCYTPKCCLKISNIRDRSLVLSGFVAGRRRQPYLALGHALVPNLEAQHLTAGEWCTFPLHMRQGSQVQDHLGMALVALSCCERSYGYYTFTVDLMHVRNVKIQLLGDDVAKSFKIRTEVWVRAALLSEGKQKKHEMSPTPLERPKGYEEQGWEATFKHGCTVSFSVPKDKIHLSAILLEIHGRARHSVTSKEALLGKITLGPEELFGGEQATPGGRMTLQSPVHSEGVGGEEVGGGGILSVPGDPLDARLTHWGQALRRMAKVEMWHRLQI